MIENMSPELDPTMAAIEVFTRQGYEATTVDDIADAARVSRSTFFRRFGSKDDVVFSDHEVLLRRVEDYLETSGDKPLVAVCDAATMVFDHHYAHRERSLARYALLRDVASLRDREIITSQRYERAFSDFLRRKLPETSKRSYVSIAFSAAAVALHNAALRQWLHDPGTDTRDMLNDQLKSLVLTFGKTARSIAGARKTFVAVFDETSDPAEVARTVASSLLNGGCSSAEVTPK